MFKKILVAGRGDVAVRVIQACREINVPTVAVSSDVDRHAFHTNLACESYCIGPADIEKSYYNADAIIFTALKCGADAIHPCYGPTAENTRLARLCRENGITFIGAAPEVLDTLADSEAVFSIMKEAGVPLTRKLCSVPKQIDVQIARDISGNTVVIGDRDTSLCYKSRRLICEAPAYGISEKLRKKLWRSAIAAACALGFVGVGSVIFFVDTEEKYVFVKFMPRLQVGCSVTELQTRVDLIHWGIRIAAGQLITFGESSICRIGHAIGGRVYAISPETFIPSPGKIDILHVPDGLDVHFYTPVYQGYTMPREYTPLIGTLVVYSRTRESAIGKFRSAAAELVTSGVHNNSEICSDVLTREEFISGEYDIDFFNKYVKENDIRLRKEE